ncbi:MAG TPA: mannose-1-phosphate guanylyltransferase [Thermomicrobiales bacterium]|nr:mannose-1-phosphate guanylyltransferase [Thermomicrobiales bacterium]
MTLFPHQNPDQNNSDDELIENFWAVIPAGGSGTRLWPLSRSARPKFLLPLLGDESLLQQTFARLKRLTAPSRIMVVCGPAHVAAIARQLPDLPTANIIVEPSPNGTGPALALASALIQRQNPRAVMGSFAADHGVIDVDAFCRAVRTSIAAAETGDLVTVGLQPTRPETGYGYIERTDDVRLETVTGTAYRAERFVEKPPFELAQRYVESGKFLWNAAMFVWRVDALTAELRRLQPEIHAGVRKIAAAWESRDQEQVTARVWATLPNVTIDNGVMENASRVAVVPAEMGWSDVGDWHGLGELIDHDDLGNSVRGDLVQIDTTNSVVWSESNRMVATVGMDNVIVVDTEDALLVIDRSRSQEVRKIVDLLKAATHAKLT